MSEEVNLTELADKVKSREDFYVFINYLINDYNQSRKQWENNDIESFLSGLGGIAFDLDAETPSWSTFAHMLYIATVYE